MMMMMMIIIMIIIAIIIMIIIIMMMIIIMMIIIRDYRRTGNTLIRSGLSPMFVDLGFPWDVPREPSQKHNKWSPKMLLLG